MVPLGLADRLSVADRGGRRRRHPPRDGFDPGPPPTTSSSGRSPRRAPRSHARRVAAPPLAVRLDKAIPVAAGLAGGSSDAAAAIDGALEAWGARSSATRSASALRGEPRQRRPVLPRRWRGAHRGSRRAGDPPPRRSPTSADQPTATPGVLLVTPPVPAHTAAVFAAWAGGAMGEPGVVRRTSEHFASEFGSGLTRPCADRASGRARVGQRPLAGRGGGRARPRAAPPGADAAHPPPDRPVGLRSDALGALSFAGGGDGGRGRRPGARSAAGELPIPGDGAPFVAATTIQAREE